MPQKKTVEEIEFDIAKLKSLPDDELSMHGRRIKEAQIQGMEQAKEKIVDLEKHIKMLTTKREQNPILRFQ